ncbi:Forkhead box protein I2, partial [Linnemannia elongata]
DHRIGTKILAQKTKLIGSLSTSMRRTPRRLRQACISITARRHQQRIMHLHHFPNRRVGPRAIPTLTDRITTHSSSSMSSSSSVSGSMSDHASSSNSAAGAGSVVRPVPAESTTSPVAVTTTASGENKTTRRRRRPNESYSTIIIKAIRNSPLQRLKLSEIYDYVSREIPTMDGNDKGWQNTVRHNLSHNKCFRRIVIKDEDLPSGSADDEDGDSKPSSAGKASKQAKRGKGGCWVLVPENLEESMSSSRPKKSSTDQGQSPAAPGAGSGGLISSTSPKIHRHHTADSSGGATIPKAVSSSTGGAYLSPQLSMDFALSHPHSAVMDIDRNVASMMIAEQQLQQSGRHHEPLMHPSHYAPLHPHSRQHPQYSSQSDRTPSHHQQQRHHASNPYLPPHYLSSSPSSSTAIMNQSGLSSAAFQSFSITTRPGQHSYNSSGDERDHDNESDDGQSGHSVLSADRENDDDGNYDGDEAIDAMEEDDSVSHSSFSRQSRSRSPSASYLSATSSPMEIEEADGENGGVSSSPSPTTSHRRRPGMSIQNMLN